MQVSKHRALLIATALAVSAWLTGATSAIALDTNDTRLLANPDISGDQVSFEYAGDLWVARVDGTDVRRLTTHEGTEQAAFFSPDGQHLAFSAEYDGNTDVFVVSTSGGAPTRLTFHPSFDLVQGFSPDGAKVLFASQRETFTNRHFQLYEVPVDPSAGRFAKRLPIPTALRATYSTDGSKIAYIPTPERMAQWKNYRGGTTARIWIYDVADHSVVEVPQPEGRSNDTDPQWVGDRLFFRSDRDGEFNLYSFDARGAEDPSTAAGIEAVQQHTEFDQFPVLSLGTDGQRVVFEQAGWLHSFDPDSNTSTRLKFGVSDDLDERRPRWVDGAQWIRWADLSPGGERAVFEYRGDILTLPAKKGDMRALTATPSVHERSPMWSPDGRSVAYFSDAGGEYQLHVAAQDGSGEAQRFDLKRKGGAGFYEEPLWSPDSKKIALMDNSWALFVLDLSSGELTEIAREPLFGPAPVRALEYSWSPDSRWLAYTLNSKAMTASAWVFDTKDGSSHRITDGLSDVAEPAFDRNGKYLYFLASTDAGPVKHWFAMSNADMERNYSVYLTVLQADEVSPLAPESDEVAIAEDSGDGAKANGEDESSDASNDDQEEGNGKDNAKPVRIDFDNIDQRIVALPMAAAAYGTTAAGDGRFYATRATDGGSELVAYDLKERDETVLASGVVAFELSADGKQVLYTGGGSWGIAPATAKIDQSSTALPLDLLRTRVDPPAEWAQIFREVWRVNRDFFYDPNMHGADWEAMAETYAEFLPHLTDRSDLNRVLQWMCSELAVGHHRVGGGDERTDTERVPGGLLGADFSVSNNRYRIERILGGLNWNPQLRSPLTEPGVGAAVGEYVLAINGNELTADDNLFEAFEGTAERTIDLTLGPNPDGQGSRTVRVTPVRTEGALRNRAWVEGNLAKVHQATDGRVAYVYVPNTTNLGHTYFKRYFYPQVDKQAIIVDERFNGGGQVADYYIDHLRRPAIARWATRYGDDYFTPSASIQGPKVMLIDETAGSGGDLLPWMFRKLELGPLIGKQTWGGLVGVLGFPVLLDGGFVTAPNLAIWTEDGFVVENVGVPPDIEVEQTPAEVIAGADPQLDRAIAEVLRMLEQSPRQEPKRPPFPIRARQR